jgi:hypothetical protein
MVEVDGGAEQAALNRRDSFVAPMDAEEFIFGVGYSLVL